MARVGVFGNGLATMWFHIDERRADEVFQQRAAPVLHRPVEQVMPAVRG